MRALRATTSTVLELCFGRVLDCIKYNDPDLNIDWEYPEEQITLSEKDSYLPAFKDLVL